MSEHIIRARNDAHRCEIPCPGLNPMVICTYGMFSSGFTPQWMYKTELSSLSTLLNLFYGIRHI